MSSHERRVLTPPQEPENLPKTPSRRQLLAELAHGYPRKPYEVVNDLNSSYPEWRNHEDFSQQRSKLIEDFVSVPSPGMIGADRADRARTMLERFDPKWHEHASARHSESLLLARLARCTSEDYYQILAGLDRLNPNWLTELSRESVLTGLLHLVNSRDGSASLWPVDLLVKLGDQRAVEPMANAFLEPGTMAACDATAYSRARLKLDRLDQGWLNRKTVRGVIDARFAAAFQNLHDRLLVNLQNSGFTLDDVTPNTIAYESLIAALSKGHVGIVCSEESLQRAIEQFESVIRLNRSVPASVLKATAQLPDKIQGAEPWQTWQYEGHGSSEEAKRYEGTKEFSCDLSSLRSAGGDRLQVSP